MLTARASRTIAAAPQDIWAVVSDPHHLPRWWPRVMRVEAVDEHAFTEVMRTSRGKVVRADFRVTGVDHRALSLSWSQIVEGTPFERVLASAETQLWLSAPEADPQAPAPQSATPEGRHAPPADAVAAPAPAPDPDGPTRVTVELRQDMARRSARPGLLSALTPGVAGRIVRRAAAATLEQALEALEGVSG